MTIPRSLLALAAAAVVPLLAGNSSGATVGSFTGGDPGEGLDLQGNFTYAFNIGTPGAAGKVGDADFTADDAAGVSVDAQNEIGGWTTMAFGDTDNDKRLGFVLNSIRWSAAPNVVTIRLKVEKGIEYKLQLLFSESCCVGRGFNVAIDGKTEVANFIPAQIQAGSLDFAETKAKVGAVITQQLTAAGDTLEVILDGAAADSPDINDHNAIINGLTLERISPVTDVDNDGLRDDWEKKYFGNMDATGGADSDGDGLTNLEEQNIGTDPKNADTDGDGLSDGDEVKNYKSDPNKRDTDGDGLDDGLEVKTLHTSPTKLDSDGDGVSDDQEVALNTDPANAKSKPVLTSYGVVSGAAPGKGLDLNGNFIYALAIGGDEASAVKVRDAQFQYLTENEVPGATLAAGNRIGEWYSANFGDSEEDVALAAATRSIRWSDANNADQPNVILTLDNLEVGGTYKIQLLFGEACCNRGFDVFFDDQLVVDDFNPGIVQGGINNRKQEAVITRTHFAKATTLVIRLDGRTAPARYGDHNAILSAATVEKLAGKTDSDNDGLPDEWEKLYFGNLSQDGNGDPDKDGLTNAQEYAAGTDPNVADTDLDGLTDSEEKAAGTNALTPDSDGDGLKDGDEIKTHKTNPLLSDTDGDALKDGDEVLVYHTDPFKKDTDGDGAEDGKEVAAGTDPLKAIKPTEVKNIVIQSLSGGDAGEGLDLQGKFAYAFNVSSAGAAGKAGDADFTADNAPGIKVVAPNNIPSWDTPDFGDTANDNTIEKVLQSIRYAPVWRVELNVVPGSTYKLQLLFYEQCCGGRGFNVSADGVLLAEAFIPAEIQGGVNNTAAGAVISAEITTYSEKMIIIGDGPAGRAAAPDLINDTNAILDGVTLEVLKEGTPAASPALKVTRDAGDVVITFDGTLQSSDSVNGIYTDVAGSGSIKLKPGGAAKFYRAVRK